LRTAMRSLRARVHTARSGPRAALLANGGDHRYEATE
jgi:hypothetical protein